MQSFGKQARSRPLRADAEQNRRRIVQAAGRLLAESGTDVTLERVADAAGVGIGTVYRRFRTIQDLIAVVLEEKITIYADRAEFAADEALRDPWVAFESYVRYILDQQATDLAFSDIILAPKGAADVFKAEIRRALDASILLVDRVTEAGAIRADFDHSDLYLLLNANAGVVRASGRAAPALCERFARYMLESFRCAGETPLPPAPKSWVRATHVRRRLTRA